MGPAIEVGIVSVLLSIPASVASVSFFLGGIKSDIRSLMQWAELMGPRIMEVRETMAALKVKVGL
jgi:hypothetical protein